jgi:AraC-like DNA-binding protein
MSLPVLFFYGFAFLGILHTCIFSFLAIRNNKSADLIITLFLFVQSLIILEYVFYWSGINQKYHQLNAISIPLLFLFGPLLWMYVDFVFSENNKKAPYIFHFLPAGIVLVLMLPFYFSSADLKLYHYKMIKYFVLDFGTISYFIMLHMTCYFVALLLKIYKIKWVGYIKRWLLIIVGLFGFYIACYIAYYVMINYPWFTLTTDYFVSLGMCASIVAIIFFAYGKKNILDGFPVAESLNFSNIRFSYIESKSHQASNTKEERAVLYNYPLSTHQKSEEAETVESRVEAKKSEISQDEALAIKYKNSGLTGAAVEELAASLSHLMQKEKLYRDSELKLETLADKLELPKHYVSQVINQHFQVNFFEYINLLRIQEAKELLLASDKNAMNIIEVAYAVGYNTKNTFNNAFRRIVGLTPTEFRNQNQSKRN